MKFSNTDLELIKQSEGFPSHMYLDVAGYQIIGYGRKLLHPEMRVYTCRV